MSTCEPSVPSEITQLFLAWWCCKQKSTPKCRNEPGMLLALCRCNPKAEQFPRGMAERGEAQSTGNLQGGEAVRAEWLHTRQLQLLPADICLQGKPSCAAGKLMGTVADRN